MSIEDITISDSRDCTTIQQGASSEKDSGFEETPNADVAENTQIPDSEIVRNDEVSTDKIIESVGVVTSDEIAATKKLDSSDDCCHEKINSIEHFDIEEVDDRMVISKIEIESMQIVNDSTKDKIESINKEIQIDSGNNLIASEQNVDCQMSLTNDKETESPERDRDNGEEPKMDDDFSKKPVSPESPQSCVETASNNSDGMETNNIDQKRNCMDSETQTDPNTTTPFSSIYDTPPSEQFEAKSPEMANNKYLTINSDAITNCVQEDLNCQIQRSTSESDKENFSDMENVENSDLDNEHSDVNDLLKNISDENSKGDYETTDYATSPLDHGNGDSVNDETIRTDEMMEVDEQPEEVIANEHSTEENIDEHPQEMVINELPEEKVVDEYSEEEVVDEHPEEEVGDEHPEKEIVHEYPQEVVVDKYPEEEVVHEHLEEVVVDKHQEEVVVNEQEEEELLEEHAEGVIVNEHPEELVVNEQQEEDLLNEHLEESNPEPQLKIIIESVETISDETFSAIEKNEGYLNGEKMDEEEVYNEESVIVEATSEISAIQNDCAYSNEYNYVTTTSINTVQETSQTEQKPVVVKPQENNNVNSVSLNNFKSVNSETVKVNGIKILDNRKVVLPEIFKKEELTPKKSALKVMYTSPQVIKGDFTEFERLYCEYNDKCVSDTFKDALSGPVTKLNGMPVSDNDFNILDAVQQSLLNNLTIKTQSINGNSNTDTSSSSQPSSPNITCDMDFADLRTDFESYMNKEMRAFQDGNPGASHKPLKAQKRVAISENDNKIHHDNRTAEELKFIYSKRVRYDTKVNGESSYMARHRRKESNYIRRMRKKDEKLQMEPQVHVDLFTEDELWQKLEREIEERERERLERAVYYRKHNTTESRILFRLFPSKENRVEETQTTLENYSNTGTVTSPLNQSVNVINTLETNESYCDVQKTYNPLNLTIPPPPPLVPQDSETSEEFSNSPKFLQDCDRIIENLNEETHDDIQIGTSSATITNFNFLSNNSNFYQSNQLLSSPSDKQINDNKDCNKSEINCNEPNASEDSEEIDILNLSSESELLNTLLKSIESESDSRLPFKKRRIPLPTKEEIKEKEISYPATPMISIAEVEAMQNNKLNRSFKTPAERKEMPPLPTYSYDVNPEPSPIATDQYHNHTFNNPTINYHMSNVPIPFINIPCAPYYPINPIIFPFNSNVPSNLSGVQEPVTNKHVARLMQQTKTGKTKNNVKREGLKENHLHYAGGYRTTHNNV